MLLGVWLGAAFVLRALALHSAAAFRRECDRAAGEVAPLSDMVLLRPVNGVSTSTPECLASLFAAADAAGARLVIGVQHPDDPARKEAELASSAWPRVDSEIRVDPGPPGSNRKVANLVQMTADATAEISIASDADIRVPIDYAARVAGCFADPRVGLATCAYRDVPGDRLPSRIHALITNTLFFPSTCLAVRVEGLRFALGATLAVRQKVLAEVGGLASLLDSPAEDHELARTVAEAGYRLAWAPVCVEHVLEDTGARAPWRRQVSRARVAARNRIAGHLGHVLVIHGWFPAFGLAGAAAFTGAGNVAALAAPALWWGAQILGAWLCRGALGLRARDLALVPAADLVHFAASFAALRGDPTPHAPLVTPAAERLQAGGSAP